ncbi:hypothetical protein [Phormidesmis sp. 146-33]
MARKPPIPTWFPVFPKPKSSNESRQPDPEVSVPEASHDLLVEDLPEVGAAPDVDSDQPPDQTVAPKNLSQGTQKSPKGIGAIAEAWRWQLIWLGIMAAVGGTGVGAFIWLSQAPPAIDCKKISDWSADSERLFCAQQAAQSGKSDQILAAINLVKNWTVEHPLYAQSQALLQDWSNAVLILARDRVSQRDIKGAIALARQIPRKSAVYKDAQASIEFWQEEFNRGQVIYDKIQADLKKQNWNLASQRIGELSLVTDPSWQERLTTIRQQVTHEKQGWQALKAARDFAQANPPERWGRAIALTDSIKRSTYVWALQAQTQVVRWRNTVFALAIVRLGKKDLVGASSLVDSIPKSVKLTSDNEDLVRLIRARQIEADDNYGQPALERLAPLLLASQLLQQINPQSPFYAQARALLPRLDLQAQNFVQLNLASTLSNLRQIPTLKLAIDQAKQISPNHPRRLHAQTLIAQWRKEIEWMEDRPIFRQAQQTAKSGKIGELQSAVAMVRLISPKRALYPEAQSLMSTWISQIQVIEDTPILNEARAVAANGKLGQAIQVASRIRSGRALYGDAQYLIGEWVYQIQIIEDRPILNQATSWASQGYLTRAIDVASQIAPGRGLYGEAQGLIRQWAAERAEIWRQRDQEAASQDSQSDQSTESDPSPSEEEPSSDELPPP